MNLASREEGPYQVIRLSRYTVTIDIKRPRDTVSIDKVSLALKAQCTFEAAT